MPKIPKGKSALYVYIDENLRLKLLDYIRGKYKEGFHGALSFEVEKALENYLKAAVLHTNTHKIQNPNLPVVRRRVQQIISLLNDRGFHNQVSVDEVYKAVEDVAGFDPRTKKNYLKFLVDHGYLKWVNNRVLKFSDGLKEAEDFFSKIKGRVNNERSP